MRLKLRELKQDRGKWKGWMLMFLRLVRVSGSLVGVDASGLWFNL